MLSYCTFLHGAAEVKLEVTDEEVTGTLLVLLEAAGVDDDDDNDATLLLFEVGFELSKAGIRGSFNSLVPKMGHRSKIITRSATEPPKRFGGCTLLPIKGLAPEFAKLAGLDLSEMCCFCWGVNSGWGGAIRGLWGCLRLRPKKSISSAANGSGDIKGSPEVARWCIAFIRSLASSNLFFMFSTCAACRDGIDVAVLDEGGGGIDVIWCSIDGDLKLGSRDLGPPGGTPTAAPGMEDTEVEGKCCTGMRITWPSGSWGHFGGCCDVTDGGAVCGDDGEVSLWLLNSGGILVCTLFIMLALVGKASINRRSEVGNGEVRDEANIGLRNGGDIPLELNEELLEAEDGEGLRNWFLRFIWFVMVWEMVCLAACFALSVDTKLFTKSFRLPLTTGEVKRSSLEAMGVPPTELTSGGPFAPGLLVFDSTLWLLGNVLLMKEGEVNVEVGLDNGEDLLSSMADEVVRCCCCWKVGCRLYWCCVGDCWCPL